MTCLYCNSPATHRCETCKGMFCMIHANRHNESVRQYGTGTAVAFQSANAVKVQPPETTEGSAKP